MKEQRRIKKMERGECVRKVVIDSPPEEVWGWGCCLVHIRFQEENQSETCLGELLQRLQLLWPWE